MSHIGGFGRFFEIVNHRDEAADLEARGDAGQGAGLVQAELAILLGALSDEERAALTDDGCRALVDKAQIRAGQRLHGWNG